MHTTQMDCIWLKTFNLLSFNYVKLHCFSISNTAKIFPGVVLFDCSLEAQKVTCKTLTFSVGKAITPHKSQLT